SHRARPRVGGRAPFAPRLRRAPPDKRVDLEELRRGTPLSVGPQRLHSRTELSFEEALEVLLRFPDVVHVVPLVGLACRMNDQTVGSLLLAHRKAPEHLLGQLPVALLGNTGARQQHANSHPLAPSIANASILNPPRSSGMK